MADLLDDNMGVDEFSFEALVGEGKKFRDGDALAKKAVHADRHIENLEKELADMRAELQGRLSMEEMLEKVQTRSDPANPPQPSNLFSGEDDGGSQKKIDLAEEVRKVVQTERQKERRDSNIESAKTELKKRFGADYKQKLEQIAESLEVGVSMLNDMAASSPSGFLKLVDSVAKPDANFQIPSNGKNPAANQPGFHSIKNAAYYTDLRKNDPKLYWSKKVQSEMHRQAVELGDAFFN